MIHDSRLYKLNHSDIGKGDYVLYWMQASQRIHWNHALNYAVHEANRLKLPILVYFRLIDDFPDANERHYFFMLQGLKEVRERLEELHIGFVLSYKGAGLPDLIEVAEHAALVVTDCGYLNFQRQWRKQYAHLLKCPMIQVESDVVVPVNIASHKEEYSAATLRRKITSYFNGYLQPLEFKTPKVPFPVSQKSFSSFSIQTIPEALKELQIDRSVAPSHYYKGGTNAAFNRLVIFLKEKLPTFHQLRNDPTQDYTSHLSPYLHFGQISPLFIALEAMKYNTAATDTFLEELIVRRELAINFVTFNPSYMSFDCLPDWAKRTLKKHEKDPREYIYSPLEFENGQTHDPYWNAAQKEMVITGKMHGYMRMYWGKKILEWSESPEMGYKIAIDLNNKYELDGRDANGFAGVAWCFGKHDRPWGERPVFGNIRYMNANGLKRKFDIHRYVDRIQKLSEEQNSKLF